MARKKGRGTSKLKDFRKSRFLFLVTAAFLIGVIYYANNNVSASTSTSATVTETFDSIAISPDSYKVQLVDESGQSLKAEILQKISISSLMKGKNCGPKGALPDHPNGGCFTVNPVERDVTASSDGVIVFQNKLNHIGQLYTYANGKKKTIDYYFAAGAAGHVVTEGGTTKIVDDDKNFIAWTSNTIIIRSADKKTELARVVLNSNGYLQKSLDKAKQAMNKLNSTTILAKIPASKLSTLGPDSGTPSGVSAPVVSLSPEVIGTGSYEVKFTKNNSAVPVQNYVVNDWYFECTVINSKEKDCTKNTKQQGQAGMSGADGVAKFSTPLISAGNDYFAGQTLGNNRYRIWSKSEIIAVNSDGRKIGSKTISSPFRRPTFNLLLFKKIDSTQMSKDKQKMVDKYNNFLQKDYIIKVK